MWKTITRSAVATSPVSKYSGSLFLALDFCCEPLFLGPWLLSAWACSSFSNEQLCAIDFLLAIGRLERRLNEALSSTSDGASQTSSGKCANLLPETFKCLRDFNWNSWNGSDFNWLLSRSISDKLLHGHVKLVASLVRFFLLVSSNLLCLMGSSANLEFVIVYFKSFLYDKHFKSINCCFFRINFLLFYFILFMSFI